MLRTKILPALALLLLLGACSSPLKNKLKEFKTQGNYRMAFYNVENLFDLVNAPDKADDEFTPEGKKEWTAERYQKKLNDLAKVIETMGYPAIIGLCEVENELVLKDLTQRTSLKNYGYKIVHYESPDFRGIDVALIYMESLFEVQKSKVISINFPKEIVEDYTTRDILQVSGTFRGKETLHIFVNHWPSRRGGLTESEPKRVYVSTQLRKATNQIFENDPKANIIITGDFNDEPDNNSVRYTLNALPTTEPLSSQQLYNCSYTQDQTGAGSYNYRGNWNMLDQFIVSTTLLDGSCKLQAQEAQTFQQDWMMYQDKKNGATPNKTYGGPNYYGGYSDHLPVYLDLKVRK